jgi:DNA-binding NarL/FixJ family response regulator
VEVLQALAEGLDSKQIAQKLSISLRTERNHMASILSKLEIHTLLHALVLPCATASWRSVERTLLILAPRAGLHGRAF